MPFSVPAALLLGVVAFIFFRKDGLKPVHLIVCVMLGFYLASSADREPSGVAGQAYPVRPGALGPQPRAEGSPDLGRDALMGMLVVHVDTSPQGRLRAAFLAPDLSRGEARVRAGYIVGRTTL